MKKLFLVGLLAVAAASAAITPNLIISGSQNCTPDGPVNCTFDYTATVHSDHYVSNGDFFTIYDFIGYVDGSIMSLDADWQAEAKLLGETPAGVNLQDADGDNAGLYNLVFTYIGDTPRTGEFVYAGFSAQSTLRGISIGEYASKTHEATGPETGLVSDSRGWVAIPGPGQGGDEVPEPMSMMLLGGGLSALGALRAWKKK